jgi:fibronectin-binding autotransporter adhesin
MSSTTISAGQTVTGLTLNVGDLVTVLSGGTAVNMTANGTNGVGGGEIDVDAGGVAKGTILNNQGELSNDGTATGTLVNSGGFADNGGAMTGTILNGGQLGNGGAATGTIVNSGGMIDEQWSAITKNTVINKGGIEEAYNGGAGGGLFNATVNGGVQLVDGAYAYDTIVDKGGQLQVEGGNIIEEYYNAGASYGAVINSGALETLYSNDAGQGGSQYWGLSFGTVVNSGGQENVHIGGDASGTIVNAGGIIANDSLATSTILNGGTMYDNVGGTANGTVVDGGGNEIVYAGAVANGTTAAAGGAVTDSSGTVNGSVIQAGGFQGVWGTSDDTVISASGTQAVYNGGVDTGSKISGMEFIRAGGVGKAEVITGGILTVAGGTLSNGVTFSGPVGGELSLAANSLGATISGFASTFDSIDLTGLGFTAGTKETFAGGVLTVASGANHASLTFAGSYTTGDFAVSNDGAGGTLVKFV